MNYHAQSFINQSRLTTDDHHKKLDVAKNAFRHKHFRELARLRRKLDEKRKKHLAFEQQIQTLANAIDEAHPLPQTSNYYVPPYVSSLGEPSPFPSFAYARNPIGFTREPNYEPDGYASDPCFGSRLHEPTSRLIGQRRFYVAKPRLGLTNRGKIGSIAIS